MPLLGWVVLLAAVAYSAVQLARRPAGVDA
jgi:hypothetical protein